MTTFAKNLHRPMRENRLTVKELSAELKVSDVTVSHWRNGKWEPKMSKAIRLAKRLKTTVEGLAS